MFRATLLCQGKERIACILTQSILRCLLIPKPDTHCVAIEIVRVRKGDLFKHDYLTGIENSPIVMFKKGTSS